MANAKISALTSATTPLVGTEVLPIVQSGATVKVANNDLRPKQIQSNATSGVLQVTGPTAGTTRVMTTPDANFSAARTDAAQTFTGVQSFSNTTAFAWSTNSYSAAQFIGTIATGGSLAIYTPSLNSSYGSAFAIDGSYDAGSYTSTLNLYAAGVRSGGPYNSRLDVYTSAGTSLTAKFRFDSSGNLLPLTAAKGINFENGKAVIIASSFKSLDDLATLLNTYPGASVEIQGHTDNNGTPEANKTLSQDRANAVKRYLSAGGVAEVRMTAVGYGQELPIADNATPAGKAKNRRVDFKLSY
jgi:outer membrane protein OmpA-like peptidoglycan-associated protein